MRRVFWQVAQKPGKPIYFGMQGSCALMGLPGNPAAVLIGLALHVRALLDVQASARQIGAIWHPGALTAPEKADAQRDRLVRMQLHFADDGRAQLQPLPHQDSHMLSNLQLATVLAWLPARQTHYVSGEVLRWTTL
jgi:molybdopterin molybdotransferase